jgi:hypothetical protein
MSSAGTTTTTLLPLLVLLLLLLLLVLLLLLCQLLQTTRTTAPMIRLWWWWWWWHISLLLIKEPVRSKVCKVSRFEYLTAANTVRKNTHRCSQLQPLEEQCHCIELHQSSWRGECFLSIDQLERPKSSESRRFAPNITLYTNPLKQ